MATTTEAKQKKTKEGTNLLGSPTFEDHSNGRFKCVETGHELLAKDIESYSRSRKCRLGLIDYALSHNNPLLTMFHYHPFSRSKLICKLTGDTINKSEEHIWKHMNGKLFLNKLDRALSTDVFQLPKIEQKEEEKFSGHGMEKEESIQEPQSADGAKKEKKNKMKEKKNKNKDKGVQEIISEVRKSSDEDSDVEEADFWKPPVGDCWDDDDGGDRWGSGTELEPESEEGYVIDADASVADDCKESEQLSMRTKRMSIEIGPSSFASRKKKRKKNHQT